MHTIHFNHVNVSIALAAGPARADRRTVRFDLPDKGRLQRGRFRVTTPSQSFPDELARRKRFRLGDGAAKSLAKIAFLLASQIGKSLTKTSPRPRTAIHRTRMATVGWRVRHVFSSGHCVIRVARLEGRFALRLAGSPAFNFKQLFCGC